MFDGHLDGTLPATLKEQSRKYLAENVTGMSAEEAAVAAFLSLRLSELERAHKGGGSPVDADVRSNHSIETNYRKSPDFPIKLKQVAQP